MSMTAPTSREELLALALEDCLREHGGFTIKGECERKARAALAFTDPAQGAANPPGDFYLVPREIIDQFPEININNYDHDDACALNAWGCEVVTNANPAPSVSSTNRGTS